MKVNNLNIKTKTNNYKLKAFQNMTKENAYIRLQVEDFEVLSCDIQVPFSPCGDVR